ncbi:MAG: EAL domain-containing protein [Methylomonas sp.]
MNIQRHIGVALVYALSARLVSILFTPNGHNPVLWIPGGLALAALLFWGRNLWPGILAGGILAGLIGHMPIAVSFSVAAGNTLETLCAAWLLQMLATGDYIDLNNVADFLIIALTAAISACISALIGPLALYHIDSASSGNLGVNMLHWWQADAMGILVATPLALIWRKWPPGWFSHPKRALETLCFLAISMLVTLIVFLDWRHEVFGLIARGYWIFLLLLWAAFRFGRHGVLLLLMMVAVSGSLGMERHTGEFGNDYELIGLQNFWCYQLVITLVGMSLALSLKTRHQAEDELRLAALVYQNSSEAMMITDEKNRIISINPAFTVCTGYTPEDVLGQNPRILNSGRQSQQFYEAMWNALNCEGRWEGEIYNRRKNKEIFIEWVVINTVFNHNGSVHRRVALFSDISEKKKTEELIWSQANYDPLTQLPNRRLFADRLQQEIIKAERDQQALGLLFIDLDRFKEVNDSLGHNLGDALLIQVAQRLSACVRKSDTVARLGGDEFTVILTELNDCNDVEKVAQNILLAVEQPFSLGDSLAYVSASIGITLYPADGVHCDDLLRFADQAMYSAKNKGRNRFCYFTPEMQSFLDKHVQIVHDLRDAITEQQFDVLYQPIVNLASGDLVKAEALIRWNHPQHGLIMPSDFIPVAEETGMINDLGDWIFKQATAQVRQWRQMFQADFQISINKSPVQFHTLANMHHAWTDYLHEMKLPGNCIVLEITEGLLLDANNLVAQQLKYFRDCGMQIAIDDFGTGYSALAYLEKFHIDYLKIDRSFTRNLTTQSSDLALCEAIIVMAHKLGIKVIAEGVETLGQHDLLRQAGCDYAQGYFFAPPLSADEFERLFQPGNNEHIKFSG